MRATDPANCNNNCNGRGHGPLLRANKKTRPSRPRFLFATCNTFYCAPIFTSVTSKIRVALGGKPFFGSAP